MNRDEFYIKLFEFYKEYIENEKSFFNTDNNIITIGYYNIYNNTVAIVYYIDSIKHLTICNILYNDFFKKYKEDEYAKLYNDIVYQIKNYYRSNNFNKFKNIPILNINDFLNYVEECILINKIRLDEFINDIYNNPFYNFLKKDIDIKLGYLIQAKNFDIV
jgi:hypothetical protein